MRLSLYTIRTQMKSGKYAFPNSSENVSEYLNVFCSAFSKIHPMNTL